ncbi:MAG: PPC domain-containing protein [Deltaproteobacteria bacterium]|nr:PPC domain-containing protein [Deltaproteobacteria bacterium]
MKPTLRLILLALIIFLFGAVPVIHAQTPASTFTGIITGKAICADPPQNYSGEIELGQVDYWEIWLVAGQKLIIDVDAETIDSTLDAYLEVLDEYENVIALNNDQTDIRGNIISLDPYLEVTATFDGYYYIAISSAITNPKSDSMDLSAGDPTIGPYSFLVQCFDDSSSQEFTWPVVVGDLIGATGSNPGSLLKIDPEKAESSLPFPLDVGPVIDIEFDPASATLFVATHSDTGSLYTIDPNTGAKIKGVDLNAGSIVALEAADGVLYGVHLSVAGDDESFSLVTIDKESLEFTSEVPITESFRALAYHSVDKIMYAASGADLFKINLTSSPIEIEKVASTGLEQAIVALDFDHENVLYAVDIPGDLYKISDLNSPTGQPVKIGTIAGVAALLNLPSGPYSAAINGLTFVVGNAPPNVEPIKTLCSSTLTSPTSASSTTGAPKLSRLKLKKNPLHRAIGLFKFTGKAGETVTFKLAPEVEEAVVTGEEYAVSSAWIESCLEGRGKGRVFLGIRDAIPNVDFRTRKKDLLPFEMSADLPADGEYYVMVIRPLLRYYQTDYCLTLESDHPESEAWQTLDVVWPGDDSEEDAATTSTEVKTLELQSAEVDDEGAFDSADTTLGETTEVVPALTSSEPVIVSPDSGTTESLVEEGSVQEEQAVKETTVDDTAEVAPAEAPAAEATDEPVVLGAPAIPEETAVENTAEVAPAEEPAAAATDEPAVLGAPAIPEETTIDNTAEVVPAEEPAAAATDQPAVMGAPAIPEETTVDNTAEVVPAEEPAAAATDEPAVLGAPAIPEETTIDNTAEVVPDESVDQVSGDSASTDGSGSAELAEDDSDGAESAEGGSSDVVTEETTEDSIS